MLWRDLFWGWAGGFWGRVGVAIYENPGFPNPGFCGHARVEKRFENASVSKNVTGFFMHW